MKYLAFLFAALQVCQVGFAGDYLDATCAKACSTSSKSQQKVKVRFQPVLNYYFLGNTAEELYAASGPETNPKAHGLSPAQLKLAQRADATCAFYDSGVANSVTADPVQNAPAQLVTAQGQTTTVQTYFAYNGGNPTQIDDLTCSITCHCQ